MASSISSFLLLFLILQDSCHCFRSPLSVFKRFQESSSQSNGCSGPTRPVYSEDSSDYTLDIRMPGVTPTESDTYLCKSYRLPEDDEAYVVDFRPHASMDTAHHMLLFGCGSPSSTEEYWDCGAGTCTDKSSIMYAWARNAPPTKLPKDVGFKVGGNSGIKYFVLQVHYGDAKAFQDKHKDCTGVTVQITPERQPMIAGIYLLMSMDTVIPPEEKAVYSDIACAYEKPAMYPFAYRVHTHQLGQVVSGYRIRNGKWTLIGRQSPQLPQAFYSVEHPLDVRPGDILAARCVFTGQGRTSSTYIGGTSSDEMCNLYIMYYMEAAHASSYMTCVRTGDPTLFNHIPEIANIPVPVSPDMVMMGHSHHKGMKEHEERNIQQQPKREEEQVLDQDVHLEEAIDWPGLKLNLGQVSGLALDPNNNLVIFHRGDHVWDENSFDRNFVYQERGIGPIEESTILIVSPNSSTILQSAGKNLFYLPHGITIDRDGNFWATDVALHQVFKLGPDGSRIFTLGKAFQPGSDRSHFCQPTDVAVDPITGNFFVSDGYCNSRIMQFSPQGMFIMQWGEASSSRIAKPGEFRIPHSLALIPDQGQLCVADRENGRIQCFHSETGHFVKQIKHAAFGSRVFAVSYASGTLYAVNGKSYYGDSEPVQGFTMNFTTGEIVDTFVPVKKTFDMPHDLVASDDGAVYVGDAHANTVWKFSPSEKAEHRSVKKAGIQVEEITETEILETRVRTRPKTNITAQEMHHEQAKQTLVQQSSVGVSFVLIITLLVIPVVVLVAIAIFIRWRKNRVYGGEEHKSESLPGGILGKLRGKGGGGLNLGTFFASHKGYSRKGFDRLSTEGSDQEKDDDDGSDSEEEYSAPPIPVAATAAAASSSTS
ncbi:PREDICTED: peptidyl-glycine alpha-amidating monooxygenase isoform X6 [Nanorana parkeri]|uniref:peptidyl-glycine alpha-amidating monooxygenase isoform X6 n=1 Tax=Nanorana parkeri TaxID=125878 RepID=UPI0008542047|nr:PREDICTED: peptidyl-glycine alpha-amidating monooxygenase isoform X6 [Nanorana parkeri]